jgi:hypothetical protein
MSETTTTQPAEPLPLQEPLPTALVVRLQTAARRIVWAVCAEYRDDAETLADLTDDELVLVVGNYLLGRQIQYSNAKKTP